MLHRPTSTPVWAPVRRVAERLRLLTGPSTGLLRYVLIAAVLCAIGCAYLWQVNELSNIHDATVELQWQAHLLEQKNVTLAEQLAQWNSPAFVEKRSAEEGYIAAAKHTIESPGVIGPINPATASPEQAALR